MKIKDFAIPQGTSYLKFNDFADGEVVKFNGVHIKPDGRYGTEVGLTVDGKKILRLPKRYNEFIEGIAADKEAMAELEAGIDFVIKHTVSATGKVYGDVAFAQ